MGMGREDSVSRSSRRDVRNPLVKVPEVESEFRRLPPEAQEAFVRMLRACSAQFRANGNHCWARHKPPMAAYWKEHAVNLRHAALIGQAIIRERKA